MVIGKFTEIHNLTSVYQGLCYFNCSKYGKCWRDG